MRHVEGLPIGVLVSVLALMVPAPAVQAGDRECAKHDLYGTDVQAIRREITQAAQGRQILWKTVYGCTNEHSAYGGVDLKPEPQPDATIIEPRVSCERDTGPWKCKSGDFRRLPATPTVQGKKRKADFHLPAKFNADVARRLIQRSADLGPALTLNQECGAPPSPVTDQFTERRLHGVRKNFSFAEWITYAEIAPADTEVQVRINDYALSFAPPVAGVSEIRFVCWHLLTIT